MSLADNIKYIREEKGFKQIEVASETFQREKITSSKDAYEYLRGVMGDTQYEEFWIIILNRAFKIMNCVCVSEGGVSGNVKPSEADIQLTKKLRKAGELMDLPIVEFGEADININFF